MSMDVAEIAGRLTHLERQRLIDGRVDWRDDEWQDHCGDTSCGACIGFFPGAAPNRLSAEDAAIRAHLLQQDTDHD